jgi:aspartyl-tRNA(Asn)/glutamyl-tRNA(Gln) amidotransferase subunit A
MSEPIDLPIRELSDLYRRREVSPLEVTKASLQRIADVDADYHSFLSVARERALDAAMKAEREFARGELKGPLQGIPYALKDNIDVSGCVTSCNSLVRRDHVANDDSFVFRTLDDAGAVFVGKLAMHEFARGGVIRDLLAPPTRNPWDKSRHTGGSSSGAGAAVSLGLVPFTIGTDTGGSVRHPATACGVVGLKPTYGSVSVRGVFPLAYSLDSVGPITRSVEDNAIVFSRIAAHDPADRYSTQASYDPKDLKYGVQGLRIGRVDHFFSSDLQADEQYVVALANCTRKLRELGATVSSVSLPSLKAWQQCGDLTLRAETYALHRDGLERDLPYSPAARDKFLSGACITAAMYIEAQQERARLKNEFDKLMQDVDVLMTLSSMDLPARLDDRAEFERTYGRNARMPFNLLGVPAISVPTGLSREGMPLGIQLAAKAFDEATLYRAAWVLRGDRRLVPPSSPAFKQQEKGEVAMKHRGSYHEKHDGSPRLSCNDRAFGGRS